jgi:hypothetical protein
VKPKIKEENISLDITSFVKRLVEINKKANAYEYEPLYESQDDAIADIADIIDAKLCQWEYELRYDLKKRGTNQ